MSSQASSGRRWPALEPVDRMILAFLVLLAVVAAARSPDPLSVLAGLAALAGVLLGAAALRERVAAVRVVHDFYPLPAAIAIFNVAGPLIGAANPARWDATFAALDQRLFGTLVTAWRSALGRPDWLTDLASLLYASYYVVPVAMAVALYLEGRRAEFGDAVFGFIATLLVSYAGYFLFPTTGPRVAPEVAAQVLGGGAVSAGVRAFVHFAEVNQLDAFPSGHTALSLVFLAYGWRLFPRWRLPFLLATSGIIFSTVYLSWHYVVDLVAGAVQAACMAWLAPALRRAFGGRTRPAPAADPAAS
ncbi:MAG TPA: phosphatase PAP2 family protein [Anaeromyxobacteraceae bacterium]|nr:phosphatase PAP2 family protein [Anaeromyxobacteraceae bacterium]